MADTKKQEFLDEEGLKYYTEKLESKTSADISSKLDKTEYTRDKLVEMIGVFGIDKIGLVPAATEDNTIGIFRGATADSDGQAGLVPPPDYDGSTDGSIPRFDSPLSVKWPLIKKIKATVKWDVDPDYPIPNKDLSVQLLNSNRVYDERGVNIENDWTAEFGEEMFNYSPESAVPTSPTGSVVLKEYGYPNVRYSLIENEPGDYTFVFYLSKKIISPDLL